MTDYQPLIARAVDGLAKNTGEARRALYERARAALVAQLRAVEPALSESDITKERLALEEAIRKVEGEAARKALSEPRTPPRAEPRFEPRAPMPRPTLSDRPPVGRTEARKAEQPIADSGGAVPAAKSSARSRILGARTGSLNSLKEEGLKGFRNVVNEVDALGAASAKAAQTARDTRDSYGPGARERTAPAEDLSPPPATEPEQTEPHFDDAEWPAEDDGALHVERHERAHDLEDEEPAPRLARPLPPHDEDIEEEDYQEPPPLRSYRSWAKIALVAIIVLGVAVTGFEYRASIGAIYQVFTQMKSRPSTQAEQTPAAQSKFGGRVPQEQMPGQSPAPGTGTNPTASNPTGTSPTGQQTPEVAQHAVLYEADSNDPQGKRFPGSVVWRTETVSPGPGLAPELVVHGDITIPDRHMTVTLTLRRNTDKALPASHTIEIMFNLPPDFPGGGISNVPGILMKDSEEVRGMPLAGLAVKVTNGFFLLGLNSADADMQRNIQLLKERGWFDILIVYNNGSRAILTMEKGPPGERAFSDAFSAWGQ